MVIGIDLLLYNTCSYDGVRGDYSDIKVAYKDAIEYVEKCNKEGNAATARIRLFDITEEDISLNLKGEIFISSKFSGKRHKNGRAIPCKEGYNVVFKDDWASTKETKIKVNKLFDEVRKQSEENRTDKNSR